MEHVKTLIQSKFKSLSLVTLALAFSALALMIRMKLNKSFFFLFLIWNIFLAIIPFAITMYLNTKPNLSRLKLAIWFVIWLAFLPNTPYIVTDLIHLKESTYHLMWLDILVVLSFAMSGLFLFYLSVLDMQRLISQKFKRISISFVTISLMFLCGFGVYLGRFLRYNSWEILSQPQNLFLDIIDMIIFPMQHTGAWLFTLGFGSFLLVGYCFFKAFTLNHPHNPEDS